MLDEDVALLIGSKATISTPAIPPEKGTFSRVRKPLRWPMRGPRSMCVFGGFGGSSQSTNASISCRTQSFDFEPQAHVEKVELRV